MLFAGIRIGKVFLVLVDVLKGQVFQKLQRDVPYLQVFAGRIALQDISEKVCRSYAYDITVLVCEFSSFSSR